MSSAHLILSRSGETKRSDFQRPFTCMQENFFQAELVLATLLESQAALYQDTCPPRCCPAGRICAAPPQLVTM